VDALVPERVWQEVSRGLMEAHPVRMFDVLRACGALQRLLPELDALWGVPQRADYHPEVDTGVHVMMVLDQAAQCQASLAVRWACLMHDLGKATTPPQVLPRHLGHEGRSVALASTVAARWRVPADCAELAAVVAAEHGNVHRSDTLGPEAVLRLLERCDALRRPERFAQALLACECDARGRLGFQTAAYPQRARLWVSLVAVQAVDTAALAQAAAQAGLKGEHIGRNIRAARLAALAAKVATAAQGA
jgi:tRNA nucleotidyltransferase (CCA-adding enzyme)